MAASRIRAVCPGCGARAHVLPTVLVKEVTCPKCRGAVRFIPATDGATAKLKAIDVPPPDAQP